MITQEFNGKLYKLHTGEKYLTRGIKKLHREVWKHYNGDIPKGMHIHHINENKLDNRIENLELIESSKHLSNHSKEYHKNNPDKVKKHLEDIRPMTKQWHGSDEGLEWHKQHAVNCNFGNLTYGEYKCNVCGKEFTRKTLKQVFCSNNCKSQYRRISGLDDVTKQCAYCGQNFIANKYAKAICCSYKCGGQYRKAKKIVK